VLYALAFKTFERNGHVNRVTRLTTAAVVTSLQLAMNGQRAVMSDDTLPLALERTLN
jgi:hypothetical protein